VYSKPARSDGPALAGGRAVKARIQPRWQTARHVAASQVADHGRREHPASTSRVPPEAAGAEQPRAFRDPSEMRGGQPFRSEFSHGFHYEQQHGVL
jgi:hypothetical protein